jgi:glycolate oxidase subunit GlcD
MDRSVVRALRAIVGDAGLITDPTGCLPYESDALAIIHQKPACVVLPATTDEAARAMTVLHEADVPIVPRGAGTGLAGGATPVPDGVVMSVARMTGILEINKQDRFARVEAGVVNENISRACKSHGLFYAPDPSSQKACTIGGNVGTNAGGPHCLRYGCTTRHILGLVIVTPEGEILDLSQPVTDPDDLDLVGLFTGCEGMFGLATEVTVRLLPLPEVTETILAVFTNLDDACDTVSSIIAARLDPSALEILDALTIEAVEASVYAAGYPRSAQAVLLVESEGSETEVATTIEAVESILATHHCLEVWRARDDRERKRLWAGRKGAFGAMGRIAPDLYVADVVVPRTRLREMVSIATDICHGLDLRIANVFHAGDGNLHPNICFDRRDEDEMRRVLEAGEKIMDACLAMGGSISGEHGIGLEKRAGMVRQFQAADLEVMERVRAALDPKRLLNPGKLLPSRSCMEIGDGFAAATGEGPSS